MLEKINYIYALYAGGSSSTNSLLDEGLFLVIKHEQSKQEVNLSR